MMGDQGQKKRKLDGGVIVSDEDKRRNLSSMLGPISADQLRNLLTTAAVQHDSVYDQIIAAANLDPATRKLFVRGLAWETTTEELLQVFQVHGEVEEGAVIMDKMTGKSKGFAFITYKNITSANAALAEPNKQIGGRTVSCNLAALGPVRRPAGQEGAAAAGGYNAGGFNNGPGMAAAAGGNSVDQRKLFVRGLSWDTTTDTLLRTFSEYGEIEEGAVCMDRATGKSRGFAFVTFANVEAANVALSQEAKVIDGRTTHCNLAIKGKNRNQTMAAPVQAYGMAQQQAYGYPQYGQVAAQGYQQQQRIAQPQQQYYQQQPAAQAYQQMPQTGMPQQQQQQQQQMMGMYNAAH